MHILYHFQAEVTKYRSDQQVGPVHSKPDQNQNLCSVVLQREINASLLNDLSVSEMLNSNIDFYIMEMLRWRIYVSDFTASDRQHWRPVLCVSRRPSCGGPVSQTTETGSCSLWLSDFICSAHRRHLPRKPKPALSTRIWKLTEINVGLGK